VSCSCVSVPNFWQTEIYKWLQKKSIKQKQIVLIGTVIWNAEPRCRTGGHPLSVVVSPWSNSSLYSSKWEIIITEALQSCVHTGFESQPHTTCPFFWGPLQQHCEDSPGRTQQKWPHKCCPDRACESVCSLADLRTGRRSQLKGVILWQY
jgi:hypothetical protein